MTLHDTPGEAPLLNDGLGARMIADDDHHGRVEVLAVSDVLASASMEHAIRAHAARMAAVPPSVVAPVHRIDRHGDSLQVTAACLDGMRLSAMLEQLEAGALVLADDAILELAARVVRGIGALHAAPGSLTHGTIIPAHIVLTAKGGVALTDSIFGPAIESLQWNRERMWRTFGVALPSAASIIRFDQRADVTQLGASVLAIMLRRRLAEGDYPSRSTELVAEAAEKLGAVGSAIRTWLQQALHLHPRPTFASAVDAARAFTDLVAATKPRTPPRVVGIRGARPAAWNLRAS
jgi:hypothetical protein